MRASKCKCNVQRATCNVQAKLVMGKGAGHVSDDDTLVVLRKLAISLPSLYLSFYAVALVALLAAFSGGIDDHTTAWADMPFVHEPEKFGEASRLAACALASQLAVWVVVGPLLLYYVVDSTRKCWDYAATFAFVHFVLTCAMTQAFPTNYRWWLVTMLGGLWTSSVGEFATYRLKDMRDIELDH